jgi:hypothetical protein
MISLPLYLFDAVLGAGVDLSCFLNFLLNSAI